MSVTTPSPKATSDYEGAGALVAPLKKWGALKTFWKTRRAILDGEPLYNQTQTELTAHGLLGPWTFVFAQVLVGSGPALAGGFMALFSSTLVSAAAPQLGNEWAETVVSVMATAVYVPLACLICVYAFAYACLPPGFVSMAGFKAAQRKYLYLCGAYGFWPQLCLSIGFPLYGRFLAADPSNLSEFAVESALLAGPLILVGGIWLGKVELIDVTRGMFDYDYLEREESMFILVKQPPLFKYFMVILFGIPIALFVTLTALLLVASVIGGLD